MNMLINFILRYRLINCIVFNSGNKSGFFITILFEDFVIVVTHVKHINSVWVHFQLTQQDMVICC